MVVVATVVFVYHYLFLDYKEIKQDNLMFKSFLTPEECPGSPGTPGGPGGPGILIAVNQRGVT